jgi:hypothetical protein
MMGMSLRRFLAVVVAFGLIAAYPSSASAEDKDFWTDPDPKAGSNPAAEIMALQRPLVEAGEAILNLDPEKQALGGIRLRVRDLAMEIYWKGERPEALYEQVAKLEEQGYRAEVYESLYSGLELAKAQEEIVTARDAYPGLMTIGPIVDGSGLHATFDKDSRPPKKWPVPVEVVQEPEWVFIDRNNDSAPFWGGGVVRMTSGGFLLGVCSTGFAVWRRNWFTVTEGMLTAEHCNRGGGALATNGIGTRALGVAETPSAAAASHNSDSLFIPTNSHPRMFDGLPVGAFTKPVVGRVNNFVGQLTCTSGASTGVHCDIITDQISTTALVRVSPTDFVRVDMMVMGSNLDPRGVAAGSGDSGGPVFTLTNNFASVLGAGIMSIAQFGVACNVTGPAFCGNRVGFVDINWVLRAQQAEIMVTDMVL